MRELLNTIHDDPENYPEALTQPEEVVEITHILGTYPYVSANGYEHLATTGLILEEYSKPVSLKEALPKLTLNSISIYTDEWGISSLQWSADGFGATNEEGLKNISLSKDDIYVEAWGTELFNYSWILGEPVYVAKIYVDGQFQQEVTSYSPYYWIYYPSTSKVKACGYFYYPGGPVSNEVCTGS